MQASKESVEYYKEQLDSLKDMMQRSNAYMQKLQSDLTAAKQELELKHIEVLQSVNYAEGIQKRLVPDVDVFKDFFTEAGFYIRQQSTIGGDLIYAREREGVLYFGLMDCTGHGIPGALIAMMGFSFLDEIVKYGSIKKTGEVMEILNHHFMEFFKSRKNEPKRADGMDGIFCMYNPADNLLSYCTVGRPLWLKTKEGWEFIKSDRLSIGGDYSKRFICHHKQLQPGDEIFIFSDGLSDQFGGQRNKKFMSKRIKQTLYENERKSIDQKVEVLIDRVTSWKNDSEQTDDISFLSLKV